MATITPGTSDGLADFNEPDFLYEVVDGRVVEKLVGAYECWVAGVIFGLFDRYLLAHPLSRAVQEMIFDLRPVVDRERRPDVAYISF
jgi:hypothetical protein